MFSLFIWSVIDETPQIFGYIVILSYLYIILVMV